MFITCKNSTIATKMCFLRFTPSNVMATLTSRTELENVTNRFFIFRSENFLFVLYKTLFTVKCVITTGTFNFYIK